jgi:putative ABC transport system substrate-binding protein
MFCLVQRCVSRDYRCDIELGQRTFLLAVIAIMTIVALNILWLTTAASGDPFVRLSFGGQKVARLGFVGPELPSTQARANAAFFERLHELGWVQGDNLIVERRWAEGRIERLSTLMADVVQLKVDVIVTVGTPAALAARKATASVPIVVASMGDPVAAGVAVDLGRPGGNLTGLSLGWTQGIPGKLLELMQEAIPRLTTVAVIGNPDSPAVRLMPKPLDAAAAARGVTLRYIDVRGQEGLNAAFDRARQRANAVIVLPDPLTMQHRQEVTALAARYRLPAIYGLREFAESGGLMAYAPDHVNMFRHAADYVDRILRGAKPEDLPIEQPTRYALTVNLKAAKALGIKMPESILLRADEIIR